MNRVFSSSSFFFFLTTTIPSSVADNSTQQYLPSLFSSLLRLLFTHVIPVKNNSSLLRNSAHSKSNNIPVNTSACTCAWFISDDRNQRRKTAKRKRNQFVQKIFLQSERVGMKKKKENKHFVIVFVRRQMIWEMNFTGIFLSWSKIYQNKRGEKSTLRRQHMHNKS